MNMYDDLDPGFTPWPDSALPLVERRVRMLRLRRRVAFAGAGAMVLAVALTSVALATGGAKHPRRLSVESNVTTTEVATTTQAPRATETSTATTTTAGATTTTGTTPPTGATAPPVSTEPTTTTAAPGHLTIAFDRPRLVIQSGTSATIAYTVTNDGGAPAIFSFAPRRCVFDELWPDDRSRTHPVGWPVPTIAHQYCASLERVSVGAHDSFAEHLTLVAGLRDDTNTNVVPAPPGETSYLVENLDGPGRGEARLPVTITPPASEPLTVSHPAAVTTASGAQHVVDFTITNHLPFPVRYVDQGPCSKEPDAPCSETDPGGSMDLRFAPFASAVNPLYLTYFTLGAGETKSAQAIVDGTTSLGPGNPDMPPGVYHFDWDGQKVELTVTPPGP